MNRDNDCESIKQTNQTPTTTSATCYDCSHNT